MNSLFQNEIIKLNIPNGDIEYIKNFFHPEKADEMFLKLKNESLWIQDKITVFGKEHLQPRLTSLYGNKGKTYGYSNIQMQPNKWTPLLIHIKEEIEKICNTNFTTVLLNRYRNGQDSMGWHNDNEKELGKNPIIASLSLGEERVFQLKHIQLDYKKNILLEHGSLLIMKGETQHFWKHQISKTKKEISERINLTFRKIK